MAFSVAELTRAKAFRISPKDTNYFAVLFDQVAERGFLVVLESAKQRRWHAAVRALRAVLVKDVEKGEFAFGVGPGFLWHARL